MCSRSSILIFHIYIYTHFFFTLFSYKSNSHQAEKRGYLCGVWYRQEQVIGVLYTVHLLLEFSAIRFIVFLPLKEIHPCLKNIHGPDAWEIRSNPPTTTTQLRLSLHIPTSTWSTYFAPHPEKRHPQLHRTWILSLHPGTIKWLPSAWVYESFFQPRPWTQWLSWLEMSQDLWEEKQNLFK